MATPRRVVIALGYLLLAAGFRWLRIESPAVRLIAVLVVLLVACCPMSLPVSIAWYPPVDAAVASADLDYALVQTGREVHWSMDPFAIRLRPLHN